MSARLIPIATAAVNGLSPFLISVLIILPFWADSWGAALPAPPLSIALALDLLIVFMLGVFLGRISGQFWLMSGLKALAVALLTAGVIYIVT